MFWRAVGYVQLKKKLSLQEFFSILQISTTHAKQQSICTKFSQLFFFASFPSQSYNWLNDSDENMTIKRQCKESFRLLSNCQMPQLSHPTEWPYRVKWFFSIHQFADSYEIYITFILCSLYNFFSFFGLHFYRLLLFLRASFQFRSNRLPVETFAQYKSVRLWWWSAAVRP
jgi:hypothetical protein